MANHYHYKRYVIGKNGIRYVEGMVEYGRDNVFKSTDSPKKWGMTCFDDCGEEEGVYDDGADNITSYWNIGFVSDEYKELYSFPSMFGKHFAWCTKPSPYWFCRTRNWMPYWGKATRQRHKLVKEIRAHWAEKWRTETLPEMKKALVETTPIPKDVVDFVMTGYFEYPYERVKVKKLKL